MACQLASNSAPGQQAAGEDLVPNSRHCRKKLPGCRRRSGVTFPSQGQPRHISKEKLEKKTARKSSKNPAGKAVKTIKSGVAERGKLACRLASISAANQQAGGGEPVPNPRHCRKILSGCRGRSGATSPSQGQPQHISKE